MIQRFINLFRTKIEFINPDERYMETGYLVQYVTMQNPGYDPNYVPPKKPTEKNPVKPNSMFALFMVVEYLNNKNKKTHALVSVTDTTII